MEWTEIIGVGKGGVATTFKYSVEIDNVNGKDVSNFSLIPENEQFVDLFSFSITHINDTTAKVTVMDAHHRPEYSAKGIPEALIKEANLITGKRIISSKSYVEEGGEFRTQHATKVWNRLVDEGRAEYDNDSDTYTYLPEQVT